MKIQTTKDEAKTFQRYLKSMPKVILSVTISTFSCYRNGIGTIKGYCYQHGIGTTKDKKKAFQWYLKSAEGGNHMGQRNLGCCYQQGIGTIKDEEKAFQWYLRIILDIVINKELEQQKMKRKHFSGT
ncbi:hypothetical protein Glove_114g176 [Diversispora epigaea]|uniref:Uncharacterized protein n=1 Tax=Diversispora epigaea TaxID=1348612 RepID=A0A397JA50_9GLOM|nr:hypothetical protein Glove_114g176 [Diversispora epigaea]